MDGRIVVILSAGSDTGLALRSMVALLKGGARIVVGAARGAHNVDAVTLRAAIVRARLAGRPLEVLDALEPDRLPDNIAAVVVLGDGRLVKPGAMKRLASRLGDALGRRLFILTDADELPLLSRWVERLERKPAGVEEVVQLRELIRTLLELLSDAAKAAVRNNVVSSGLARRAEAAAAKKAAYAEARNAVVNSGGEVLETPAGVLVRLPVREVTSMDEVIAVAAAVLEDTGAAMVEVNGALVLARDVQAGLREDGTRVAVLTKGSLSELSLKVAAGAIKDRNAVLQALRREFVELRDELREFRTIGVTGVSAPLSGLDGVPDAILHRLDDEPELARDLAVDVGVGVRLAKKLAGAAGFSTVEGFIAALEQEKVGLLLAREPMTGAHRTHLKVRLRVVETRGPGSPVFVAPSTMKALFGDQDGDDVVLFLVSNKEPHKGRVRLGKVAVAPLVGAQLPKAIAPSEAGLGIGIRDIADGRFRIKQLAGIRAAAGADAKLLVSAWMTGCNAAVILAHKFAGPEAAARLYDLLAPMTEEIMDAGKESSGGSAGVNLGLPFAPAIVRLIEVNDVRGFSAALNEVAEGVLGFFGDKAQPLAARLREAAGIMNDVASAFKAANAGTALIPERLPASYLVSGTVYNAVPGIEDLEPVALVDGAEAGSITKLPAPARAASASSLNDELEALLLAKLQQEPEPTLVVPTMKDGATMVDVASFLAAGLAVPATEQLLKLFEAGRPSIQLLVVPEGRDAFRVALVVGQLTQLQNGRYANTVACLFATEPIRLLRRYEDGRSGAVLVDNGSTGRVVVGLVEPTSEGGVVVDPVERIRRALMRGIAESLNRSNAVRRAMARDGGHASVLPGMAAMLANTVRATWHEFISRHSQPVPSPAAAAARALTVNVSEPWRHALSQGYVEVTASSGAVRVPLPERLGYSSMLDAVARVAPAGSWVLPAKKGSDPLIIVNPASVADMEALGATSVAQNMRRFARELIAEKAIPVELPDGRRVNKLAMRMVVASVPGVTGANGDSTEGLLLSRLPGKLIIRRSIQLPADDDQLSGALLAAMQERGPEFHLARRLNGELQPLDEAIELELLGKAARGELTPADLEAAGVEMSALERSLAPGVTSRSIIVELVATTGAVNAVKTYVCDGMVKGIAVVTGTEMTAVTPDGEVVAVDGLVGAEAVNSKTSLGTILFGTARLFGLDTEEMNVRLADAWAQDVRLGDTVEHKLYHEEIARLASEVLAHVRAVRPNWVDAETGDIKPVELRINGEPVGHGLLVEVVVAFDDDTDLTRGRDLAEGVGLPLRDQVVLRSLQSIRRLHPAVDGQERLPLQPRPNRDGLVKLYAIRHILNQVGGMGNTPPTIPPGNPPQGGGPRQAPLPAEAKKSAEALVESLSAIAPPAAKAPDPVEAPQPAREPEPPVKEEPAEMRAHFDGGASGNPGPAGCAAVLYVNGREVAAASRHYPLATNNEMEWRGAIAALKMARHLGWRRFTLVGDSQLVIGQLRGEKKVKSPALLPLYEEAVRLLSSPDWKPEVEFVWVPREQNARANELAQAAELGPDKEVRFYRSKDA
jgi:ribonuclease HI